MEMAEAQAKRSTCDRAQVGVVIARDGRVLATGYNGAPAGLPHCDHENDDREELVDGGGSTIARVYTGPGCQNAVHAEANAVAYAARYGVALDGSVLYTTYTPCLACAQIVINAGVREVVALKPYRDTAGRDLILAAGLSMVQLPDVR
jgi:dCMP deaminase